MDEPRGWQDNSILLKFFPKPERWEGDVEVCIKALAKELDEVLVRPVVLAPDLNSLDPEFALHLEWRLNEILSRFVWWNQMGWEQ